MALCFEFTISVRKTYLPAPDEQKYCSGPASVWTVIVYSSGNVQSHIDLFLLLIFSHGELLLFVSSKGQPYVVIFTEAGPYPANQC